MHGLAQLAKLFVVKFFLTKFFPAKFLPDRILRAPGFPRMPQTPLLRSKPPPTRIPHFPDARRR